MDFGSTHHGAGSWPSFRETAVRRRYRRGLIASSRHAPAATFGRSACCAAPHLHLDGTGVSQFASVLVSSGRKVSSLFRNRLLTIQPELTVLMATVHRIPKSSGQQSGVGVVELLRRLSWVGVAVLGSWSNAQTACAVSGGEARRSAPVRTRSGKKGGWTKSKSSSTRVTSAKVAKNDLGASKQSEDVGESLVSCR
ncbi:hypothetical protein BH11ARM1_BH11ARM1_04060 [soil metagenome]